MVQKHYIGIFIFESKLGDMAIGPLGDVIMGLRVIGSGLDDGPI